MVVRAASIRQAATKSNAVILLATLATLQHQDLRDSAARLVAIYVIGSSKIGDF